MLYTLAFLVSFSFQQQTAHVDTIVVHDSVDVSLPGELLDQMFYPKRAYLSSPKEPGGPTEIDSIRVGNQEIDKGNQNWYLVVYDKKGIRRLEGNFYDQFPCGKIIQYSEKGKISAEGNYQMAFSKKPVSGDGEKEQHFFSVRTGTWKFYNEKQRLVREEDYGTGGKIMATRYYDPKGKLTREEK
jgi:hypothetical protein